jgi:hypothetical protein
LHKKPVPQNTAPLVALSAMLVAYGSASCPLTVEVLVDTIQGMRDIRDDLQDRLQAVDAECEQLQKRLASLEEQRKMLNVLLQEERRRWPDIGASLPGYRYESMELSDVIRDIMSDGTSWLGKAVAGIALDRGYQFGRSKPARVVHSTLIGMQNKSQVKSLGGGRWKLVPGADDLSEGAGD